MIFKLRFGQWRLTITLAPVIDVVGVDSRLEDGDHILMWDFDEIPLRTVLDNLHYIQVIFSLPNIYILKTTKPSSYIAYCFKRFPWELARGIIGITPDICENFYKWGVFRKRFTLRVTKKHGKRPRIAAILISSIPEDVSIHELRSWVQYETLAEPKRGVYIELAKGYSNTRRL